MKGLVEKDSLTMDQTIILVCPHLLTIFETFGTIDIIRMSNKYNINLFQTPERIGKEDSI